MNNKILWMIAVLVLLLGGAYMYMDSADKEMAENINSMTAPTEQTTLNTNTYTLAQVGEHSTRDNCWLAMDGKVYNVSSFVDKHPGGDKILQGCGTDATELFGKIKAHAKDSVQALKEKFVIGALSQ